MIELDTKYVIDALAMGADRTAFDPLYTDLEGWAKIKKCIVDGICDGKKCHAYHSKWLEDNGMTNKAYTLNIALLQMDNININHYEKALATIHRGLTEDELVTWELL